MFTDLNEKFESERGKVFGSIDAAFSSPAPNGWEKYSKVEDFEHEFGNDFISEYWRDVYDREVPITKYVLPFVMKYFASGEKWSIADAVNLELLVMQLTPSVQHEIGFGYFFEAMYSQYSSEQKRAICEWLSFLKEYANEPMISGIEGAISYWCI